MSKEIFADKTSNIYVNGTIVRIDFANLDPSSKDTSGNPVFAHSARVVMPLDAFIESFTLYQNIMNQLIERGVISMTPPEPAKETENEQTKA